MTIRDVERSDAGALAAVHADAWLGAYRGLISDAFLDGISVETWTARWAQRLTGDELPPARVAVRDGAIVGSAWSPPQAAIRTPVTTSRRSSR